MKDRRGFIGYVLIIVSSVVVTLSIAVRTGLLRLYSPLSKVQTEIEKLILNGKKIIIIWECGSDQEIIHATVDGERMELSSVEIENEFYTYLINHLEIWGVGEFSLEGKGEIVIEGKDLFIVHNSEFKDYSMEVIPDNYENEKGEILKGRKKLF
jgi:hypothetical protein